MRPVSTRAAGWVPVPFAEMGVLRKGRFGAGGDIPNNSRKHLYNKYQEAGLLQGASAVRTLNPTYSSVRWGHDSQAQTWRLRPRKVNCLSQGHIADERQGRQSGTEWCFELQGAESGVVIGLQCGATEWAVGWLLEVQVKDLS